MKLSRTPDLLQFLATSISNSDPENDLKAARDFVEAASPERQRQVVAQAKLFVSDEDFPLDELGSEANRWFADEEEGRSWLSQIIEALESEPPPKAGALVVKDSNGTPLVEGDSVLVIKDLKVKGGSSDLKRGTLIRKIHLIDDPGNIECRVDGSTLVLKTQFLKKA